MQSASCVRWEDKQVARRYFSTGDAPNTWTSITDTITPGLTRYYQVLYRNPNGAFCPPAMFNISNGYTIGW